MNNKHLFYLLTLILYLPVIVIADEKQKHLDDGKMMYKQLCYSCHENGEKGAPILGNKSQWEERIKLGREALIDSIIAGKGFMLPKGGGAGESRFQIGKMLDYMLSTVSDEDINKSPEMQQRVKRSMQIRNGLQLYAQNCFSCHNTGRNNTPQLGDKTAWAERKKQGVATLVKHVIAGHGDMIMKGGNTIHSTESVESMVRYMLSTVEH
ncbi:cytochrome c5 family protein [uncultured Cocleimonas sp.]|uniref:c-type cytochrome n=1 Tax=uncultured Cocleimonas sp. TaxID=1051587 RepID=UPI0026115980|nr:c-type cytochrome [uncultured Cocleimonas sp.]